MTGQNILKEISAYQRSRQKFCQQMAEFASKATNIPYLESEGVIDLICPLITDTELSVRISAACCLSRMANQSMKTAISLVDRNVHQLLLRELILDRNNHVHYKRTVINALKGLAKHSVQLAALIIESGGLSAFLVCLEDQDTFLKGAAICGIASSVKQSAQLADIAISQGAITLLVMCLQSHELSLKQVSACALSDIAIHGPSQAKSIAEAGAVLHLARSLDCLDIKFKKYSLLVMANIAAHDITLAELVIDTGIFPKALLHLKHDNSGIRKFSALLVQNIVKHSLNMAQLVVNAGGVGALIELILNHYNSDEGTICAAAYALGYIAGQSPHFGLLIIECKGVDALASVINTNGKSENQLAACIWALGNIGKHTPEHSKALAEIGLFPRIMEIYEQEACSNELREKAKCTLKMTLQCCLHMPALEALLYSAPPEILKYILGQFSKILPNDPAARRLFTTTGGLKKIQQIVPEIGSTLEEYINIINSCFPDDIVRLYKPGFSETILERIDMYQPPTLDSIPRKPSTCSDFSTLK